MKRGDMGRGQPQDAAQGAAAFYRQSMEALLRAEVPFLVGGAYALDHYTGVRRRSKDLDLFLRRRDFLRATATLRAMGARVELTHPHWLGKALSGDHFVDLLFSSGSGLAAVDDGWFAHADETTLHGVTVGVCPLEETLWTKSFVMERERFDGADVLHLLRAKAEALDWPRLLARFGAHWRVLLAHLVLFDYVYPSERQRIPAEVRDELAQRYAREGRTAGTERVCQGTLLSREQYLVDLDEWGYVDPRLPPHGSLTEQEVEEWTEDSRRRHEPPNERER